MQKLISSFFLITLVAGAQTGGIILNPFPNAFPESVKRYLELSDTQVAAVTKANTDLARVTSEKSQQQASLYVEIARETARDAIDATALGTRYAQLERIRREIETERQKAAQSAQAVLTAAQKVKAATLAQILTQYSTACDAANQNLLPTLIPASFTFIPGNVIPILTTSPLPALNSLSRLGYPCGGVPTFPNLVPPSRTGDFADSPITFPPPNQP